MADFETYGGDSSSSEDEQGPGGAIGSCDPVMGAGEGSKRRAPRASTSKQGGAFPANMKRGAKKPGKSVIFSGTVSADGVKLHVLPYEKATSARLVVTLPIKCNSYTLSSVRGPEGSPNFGDADIAAGVAAAFEQIVETLSQAKFMTKYQFLTAEVRSVDSAVNMVFDFAAKESKIFNSMRTILSKLSIPRNSWSQHVKKLVDPDGKALKPTADGYSAACYALSEARGRISMFASGKILVRSADGASGAKAKVAGKLEKAVDALSAEKCSKAAQAAHGAFGAPECGIHVKIKDGLDYYGFDFHRKVARPCGHGYCLMRALKADADAKRRYADGIMRFKEHVGAVSAFLASATGLFTADDLAAFEGRVGVSDITKSV